MLALWSQAHSLAILFVVWAGLGVAMAATLYDPVFAVVTRDFPDSFRTRITLITLVAGFTRLARLNYLVTCGSQYRATSCHTAFLHMLAVPPARAEP